MENRSEDVRPRSGRAVSECRRDPGRSGAYHRIRKNIAGTAAAEKGTGETSKSLDETRAMFGKDMFIYDAETVKRPPKQGSQETASVNPQQAVRHRQKRTCRRQKCRR
ncbi:MAG: hypothetical protein ACLR6B_19245 [Blautia sp.]